MSKGLITNQLFSLTGEGSGQRWIEKFPPMSTKRWGITALCTGSNLIAAGGEGEGDMVLQTVEVMNTETHEWSIAADLPQAVCYASSTVCGDHIYMLGGNDKDLEPSRSVYSCPLTNFNQPRSIRSLQERFANAVLSLPNKSFVREKWNGIADVPVTYSCCVSIYGRLLAIGGMDSNEKPTAAIHMYNPNTCSWEVISHMATPRYDCFAAVLPDNQLMVVGGRTNSGKTNSVEMAVTCTTTVAQ